MHTQSRAIEVLSQVSGSPSYSPAVAVIAEIMAILSEMKHEDPVEPEIYCEESKLSIANLLRRVVRYAKCSPDVFIVAAIYIDRVSTRAGIDVTSRTIHRLLLTAVLLAAKWVDDEVFPNSQYAAIGGHTLQMMNALERQMLADLEWDVSVDPELFTTYTSKLQQHWAWPEAVAALEGQQQPRTPPKTRSAVSSPSSSFDSSARKMKLLAHEDARHTPASSHPPSSVSESFSSSFSSNSSSFSMPAAKSMSFTSSLRAKLSRMRA